MITTAPSERAGADLASRLVLLDYHHSGPRREEFAGDQPALLTEAAHDDVIPRCPGAHRLRLLVEEGGKALGGDEGGKRRGEPACDLELPARPFEVVSLEREEPECLVHELGGPDGLGGPRNHSPHMPRAKATVHSVRKTAY